MKDKLNLEQRTLINELTKGMGLAKQLRVHMNSQSSVKSRELLLEKILSSYEKALLILNWSESESSEPISGAPESSNSGGGSSRSGGDFDRGVTGQQQDQVDVSKKRKVVPTWTDQVRICSANGLEGSADDGYCWRKYGQKDILGAKYLRSYYRCGYRSTQNCLATKQVQRSDDDPNIFEVIYSERHTCNQNLQTATSTPESLEKPEGNSQNTLLSCRTSSRVKAEDSEEMASSHLTFPTSLFGWMDENRNFAVPTQASHNNSPGSFSPGFISPAESETSYFPVPPSSCQMNMNSFGWQQSDSHLNGLYPSMSSSSDSSVVELDFSIDQADVYPHFNAFDTPGIFSNGSQQHLQVSWLQLPEY